MIYDLNYTFVTLSKTPTTPMTAKKDAVSHDMARI